MTRCLAILAVLLGATPAVAADVAATLAEDGRFDTFASALERAGAIDALVATDRPLTVFAPTDEAFERLPDATRSGLRAAGNRDALERVIGLHIVPAGPFRSTDLPVEMTTAGGDRLVVTYTRGALTLRPAPSEETADVEATLAARAANEARIVAGDIAADGALIHALDTVLLPPDLDLEPATPNEEDFVAEIAEVDDGRTAPLVPEQGRPLVRESVAIPSPEPEPRPETNATVIIPGDDSTLPPPPDPTRKAGFRPRGATVPSPRLPPASDEPATVILPAEEAVTLPPEEAAARPEPEAAGETDAEGEEETAGVTPSDGIGLARSVISVADLLGRDVRDETGETVGEVADILLSLDTRAAETVVIALDGGVLGLFGGGDRASVPADRIAIDPLDGSVVVPRDVLGGGSGQ